MGMMLAPTGLFQSSENFMFCISNLLVELRKKEFLVLFFFGKLDKCLYEVLIEISNWLVMVEPLEDKLFGISKDRFLIFSKLFLKVIDF